MNLSTLICFISVLASAPAGITQEPTYQVVVNAANPVSRLSRDELSRIFLKRQSSWAHGGTILPVDQGSDAKARTAFTKSVHGRTVSAIGTFWQQQIFAGKEIPPPQKGSDAEVLEFVRANPNAVGYVSAGTALGQGVKALNITP